MPAKRGAGSRSLVARSGGTGRPAPPGPPAPARSRPDRTARRRARQGRAWLAASVVLSALVLAAWFPLTALYHQRQALSSTSAQLAQLQAQDRQLRQEKARLSQPAEIARIARQQYQLVAPGQRAYEVLPPASAGGGSTLYPGDPARQPVVTPSASGELPPGASSSTTPGAVATPGAGAPDTAGAGSTTTTAAGRQGAARPRGLLGRILSTLEFWR